MAVYNVSVTELDFGFDASLCSLRVFVDITILITNTKSNVQFVIFYDDILDSSLCK